MKLINQLIHLFWNQEEKRLRALWRLSIHTLLVFIFPAFFTLALMFLLVFIDLGTGANVQNVLSGADPIEWVESTWVGLVIAPLATFLGILSATFLAGRWIDRRSFSDYGIRFSKSWWRDFAFGLGLGAGLMGLIFMIGWLTGSLQVVDTFVAYQQDGQFLAGFLQALLLFVFVGIYEELLSRGYHFINLAEGFNHHRIGARTSVLLAYGVSSIVFGVLHLGNPNATWVSAITISLAGIFLGLGMLLTGSLAIPIGVHITWNFFQGNVFGFAVSGVRVGATVLATEIVANDWLMGGTFGPESGLLSIAAMTLGSVLTVLWVRRRYPSRTMLEVAEYAPRDKQEEQLPHNDEPALSVEKR